MLGELFPDFESQTPAVPTLSTYTEGKISKFYEEDSELYKSLSKNDVEAIANLYNQIVDDGDSSFDSIAVTESSKTRNERIYLESVLEEFRTRLDAERHIEADWQRFLQKYILLFNLSLIHI